jgi:hypothetical protein
MVEMTCFAVGGLWLGINTKVHSAAFGRNQTIGRKRKKKIFIGCDICAE